MTFRARLFVALLLAALVPLALFGYGVRRTLGARATAGLEGRVEALATGLRAELENELAAVGARIHATARELAGDSRFRLAAVDQTGDDRRWLLDFAASAMQRAGLSMLQVQDSAGRIVSSGHFRNEFDRVSAEPLRALRSARAAVLDVRTADRELRALVRIDSFTVAGQRFFVLGGTEIDSAFVARLARDPGFAVTFSDGPAPRSVVAAVPIRRISADGTPRRDAHFRLIEQTDQLAGVRRDINRWLLTALGMTLALALAIAAWLASRVSRPLRELAERAAAVDLERLEPEFPVDQGGEVGALSQTLAAMMGRLRAGAAQLRDAERRAVVGDMSRQITHDIKNGIAPIRHVFRHLDQIASETPEQLATVYAERRETVASSVAYLDTLARNYGKLSPADTRASCDVNAVVRELVRDVPAPGAEVRADLTEPLPLVRGEPLALRRILQNLLGNALDSLDDGRGNVTIETRVHEDAVRIAIADTGRGMTREELDRAFEDFHTTKAGGTGLGLSVVRRLVADLNGTLRVQSTPGSGTRFTIDLPTAGGAS